MNQPIISKYWPRKATNDKTALVLISVDIYLAGMCLDEKSSESDVKGSIIDKIKWSRERNQIHDFADEKIY